MVSDKNKRFNDLVFAASFIGDVNTLITSFFLQLYQQPSKQIVVLPNRKDWSKLRFFGVRCHNIISFYFCSWRINKPLTGKTLSTVISIKWSIAQKYYLIHIHLFEQFSMIGSINLINIFPLPCTFFYLFTCITLLFDKNSVEWNPFLDKWKYNAINFIICVLIGF